MNKYTGEVEIILAGKPHTLVYDWRALAEVQTKHGGNIVKELFNGISPAVVADILVIGLRKKHPEITVETLMDISPPFIPMVQALDRAIAYSYFGVDEVAEATDAKQVSGDDKKKT